MSESPTTELTAQPEPDDGAAAQALPTVAGTPVPPEPATSEEDPRPELFGERLVRRGLITQTQLGEVLLQQEASGKRIGNLLVELGALDDRDLAVELGDIFGLPLVDLRAEQPEQPALQTIPEGVARSSVVLPLRLAGEALEIAVADPLDEPGIDAVESAAGREVRLLVAPASEILRAIQTSYRSLTDVDRLVDAFEAVDALRSSAAAITADEGDDAPIVRLVTQVITQGLRDRASDVHIEPQNDRVRVRFRIDGALHDVLALPASMASALVSRLKIMAAMNIADRRRSQDGQIAMTVDDREIDVRVNTCPTVWGEKAVLRLLDRTRVLYRLDDLGMRPETHAAFTQLVRAPFGMVVCAGPTGSGKTTTLYATLAEVNQTERNVTTIEDPVEYVFPSLTQIPINEQAGLTFATGLRAILRQDPDVILVGEIRDADTARIAIESALTGHLVLSSLHATDACAALQRLVDMGIEPFLVTSTVTGMASQRLIRRVCDECRVEIEPKVDEVAFYREHAAPGAPPLGRVWEGEGCNFCSQTGYRDRVGVFELVRMTESIKRLIVEGASVEELRAAAQRDGTRSLLQEALGLVQAGVTTNAEVVRSVYGG
ncbi:MAG: GspE/PulE family protein [Solirubrobacteraceae bacterium]|nr:GspE/PulE family protein [Solirubrobacteraceae bacterium]